MYTLSDIESILRPNIKALVPYRCARDDYDRGILLDANENALGDPFGNEEGLNRYPSPYQTPIKAAMAKLRGTEPDTIFTGVGSDEAIDVVIRMFCVPGRDAIIITPPTYGMYKVAAGINDVKVVECPLTPDFELQSDHILQAMRPETKVLFLCSPNNPTGNLLNSEAIRQLLASFNGMVVIDEAYIDFAETASWVNELPNWPNLIVLQTMSKAMGLAGARLGFAFAHPAVIAWMNKIKAPYNINQLTSDIAEKAFERLEYTRRNVSILCKERDRLMSALRNLSQVSKVYPSDANFVLFKIKDAFRFYKETADSGVVSRYRGDQIHCQDTIRVTVGTPEQNDAFLEKVSQWNP